MKQKFTFEFMVPGKGTKWVRTFMAFESEIHSLASALSRITRLECVKIDKVNNLSA
jgi:hypothetical protein